jgi:hypothetical protein
VCSAGDPGRCDIANCSISSNKLNGILAKDGAELTVTGSQIAGNGAYGVQLSYCTAGLQQNTISRNKQGSVAVELGTVTIDEEQLQRDNTLSDGVVLL